MKKLILFLLMFGFGCRGNVRQNPTVKGEHTDTSKPHEQAKADSTLNLIFLDTDSSYMPNGSDILIGLDTLILDTVYVHDTTNFYGRYGVFINPQTSLSAKLHKAKSLYDTTRLYCGYDVIINEDSIVSGIGVGIGDTDLHSMSDPMFVVDTTKLLDSIVTLHWYANGVSVPILFDTTYKRTYDTIPCILLVIDTAAHKGSGITYFSISGKAIYDTLPYHNSEVRWFNGYEVSPHNGWIFEHHYLDADKKPFPSNILVTKFQ
jgi:hypothetical protein